MVKIIIIKITINLDRKIYWQVISSEDMSQKKSLPAKLSTSSCILNVSTYIPREFDYVRNLSTSLFESYLTLVFRRVRGNIKSFIFARAVSVQVTSRESVSIDPTKGN